MRDYIHNACEEIDAAMFSGDAFIELDEREQLKLYISRWQRRMKEWEEIAAEVAAEKEKEKELPKKRSRKKTCLTCRHSFFTEHTCNLKKWLSCKDSDRGSASKILNEQPELKEELSRSVSYWDGGNKEQK